jgi:hypothetical protein
MRTSWAWKISENYAFEFSMFSRLLYDSTWQISFEANVTPKRDYHHCPKFDMIFVLGKWKIFEIGVYNVNHVEDEDEE